MRETNGQSRLPRMGYSGGKDSSAVSQLVWLAIRSEVAETLARTFDGTPLDLATHAAAGW